MIPKVSGWRLFAKAVIARAYPRMAGVLREKSWTFFDIFLPFLGTMAYVFVYRAIGAPEDFIGFVIMGGAMTSFWLNVLWGMGSQLYWEKESGNLALYIIAPNSLMAVLLGMALGGMLSTCLRALVILGLGSLLFQVHFTVQNFAALFGVFVLTMTALYGLGMLCSSVFLLWGREAWHLANLFQEPVYLVSGFFFPVKALPHWIALGASIIPITLGLDAMRQLVFSHGASLGFLSVPLELGLLAVLSVVFIATARYALAYIERMAIQEGRLVEMRK